MGENTLSRDDRQNEGIEKWKKSKGRGTLLYATGFGKTLTALKIIARLRVLKPELTVLVIVPSEPLKEQWIKAIAEFGLENVDVLIINTAIRSTRVVDLLIVDEVHLMMADQFSRIFERTTYGLILCLTGTIDRQDGKQVLLNQYAPVCDVITLEEAARNGWVAEFLHYKVLIDVDLTDYDTQNVRFMHHFSWFSYEFNTAMQSATNSSFRREYAKIRGCSERDVTIHAMGFIRAMKARKAFVYDHPRKIEIANMILAARHDKKVITFTKSIEHAKLIGHGEVYHGKLTKKKKQQLMDAFNVAKTGVLNSCQALNVGIDVVGVNTIIILSGDSSSIVKRQRIGRSVRKEEEKVAEIWQIVLRNTVDENWYRKASASIKTTTIDESQLRQLLTEGTYSALKEEAILFKFNG